MPKQGKTPKKKSKEKTPQKSGESEYPAMDQEELNELVQNAIEQSQAQLQQKHEEQIKRLEADREALEERLTRKFKDEVHELNRAFDESRGANPTTKDITWMRKILEEAVVAANNASLHTQKPYIPNRFLDALEEHKYNPYIRGDAYPFLFGVKSARSIPLFIDNQACLSVTNHPNNSTKSRHIALREFRIRDYHELGMIRPYWCPGNYNVADFFSKLLEKGLFTMHAHRFGMNFEETVVGKLAEVYQTVHLKEFTDFPKKDEKDPTTVFTDIHFEKKSVAYEAYHLSHGLCL